MNIADLRAKIRDIRDFPTEGILFKDITTLLKDGPAFHYVIDVLAGRYQKERVDVVVAVESRGFIFGGALAPQLSAGFVPVRKLGKLPGKTIEVEYELEYGRHAPGRHPPDARRVGARRLRRGGEDAGQRVDDPEHFRAAHRAARVGVRSGAQRGRSATSRRRVHTAGRWQRPLRHRRRLRGGHRAESVPAGDGPLRAAVPAGSSRAQLASAGPRETLMTIKNVGVIGCGLMGSGIAQVAAQAGFPVLFVEASAELVKRGLSRLREVFEGLAAKGKLDAATKDAALARIGGTPRLEDLKGCDLVVEAMTENQQLKNETFAKLDRICPPHAILATNTSSCNVTALAAATTRPRQVLGLHFFNPVPLMKFVEVARTILTDEAVVATATEWVRAVGKTPVQTKDSTAFIVNRLLVPYLLDAVRP